MKNLLKLASFITIITVIIFFSCQKDNKSNAATEVKVKKENPMAFVGQLHNEGLRYVDGVKQTSREFTPRKAFEASKAFLAEKGHPINLNYEDIRDRVIDDNGNLITDHKALFKKLKQTDRTGIPTRSINNLDVVESFMDNLELQEDLQSALAYIATFEEGIDVGQYSEEERQYYLSVTATASSSLQYWSENYDGFNITEGNPIQNRGRCGFWCWMCVAWWDTMGAAIGGIGCGPWCATGAGIMFSTCS